MLASHEQRTVSWFSTVATIWGTQRQSGVGAMVLDLEKRNLAYFEDVDDTQRMTNCARTLTRRRSLAPKPPRSIESSARTSGIFTLDNACGPLYL